MSTYVSALSVLAKTIILMRYAKEAYEWYAWLPSLPGFVYPSYWYSYSPVPSSTAPHSMQQQQQQQEQQHETIAHLVSLYVGGEETSLLSQPE